MNREIKINGYIGNNLYVEQKIAITKETKISDVKSIVWKAMQKLQNQGSQVEPRCLKKELYSIKPCIYTWWALIKTDGPECCDCSEIDKIASRFKTQEFSFSLHDPKKIPSDKPYIDDIDNDKEDDYDEIIVA